MSQNEFIGLAADDVQTLELLRTRITPMVYNLEQLYTEMSRTQDFPLNWTTTLRHATNLDSQLKSFEGYISSNRHEDSPATVADVLASLHPYPVAPLPPTSLNVAETLLRVRPQVEDEAYIASRLATAAKFCRIPADQGIEAPQDDDEAADEDEAAFGGVKRIKTNLGEDEITAVWETAGQSVVSMWQLFESAVKGTEFNEEPDPEKEDYAEQVRRWEEENERVEKIQKDLGMDDSSAAPSPAETPATKAAMSGKTGRPLKNMMMFMGEG